jgi:hypothetical protein
VGKTDINTITITVKERIKNLDRMAENIILNVMSQ